MLNESLPIVALASGSGSGNFRRRRNISDLSDNYAIERVQGNPRVWFDINIMGSGVTLLPEPIAGTGSSVLLVDREIKQSKLQGKVTTENLARLVAKIQSVFSLNISEVASVLGVRRPTIYAWVNGDSIPHNSNYTRLQDLYTLAETVQTNFGTKLGKLQKVRNVGGLSLIDLLSSEKINQEDVMKHLNTLLGMSEPKESRVHSFREMAKAANKSITINQDGQNKIDHLTGKRITED